MAVSKAQQFALKAEALGDWKVKRLRNDTKRTVIVTRDNEAFQFTWAPSPVNEGRVIFFSGFHRVDDALEPWKNTREALRIMAEPAGHVTHVKHPPTPEGKEAPTSIKVRRLPFNPSESEDDAVIISLAEKRIEWQSRAGTTQAFVPKRSRHVSITRRDGEPKEARILNFYDHSLEAGFRAVPIANITNVEKGRCTRPKCACNIRNDDGA